MIRTTVAAGKGQLQKASTRAVPLGTVAKVGEPAAPEEHSSVPLKGKTTLITLIMATFTKIQPLSDNISPVRFNFSYSCSSNIFHYE